MQQTSYTQPAPDPARAGWADPLQTGGPRPPRRRCRQLTFLAHAETARRLGSRVGPDEGVVATSNWQVRQLLESGGRQVLDADALLTDTDVAAADAFVYEITRCWYRDGGRDFTEADGISLGRVHEFQLLNQQSYPTEAFIAERGVTAFVKAVVTFRRLLEACGHDGIAHPDGTGSDSSVDPFVVYHDLCDCCQLDAWKALADAFAFRLEALPRDNRTGDPGCGVEGQGEGRVPALGTVRRLLGALRPLARRAVRLARAARTAVRCWEGTPTVFLLPYASFPSLAADLRRQGVDARTDDRTGPGDFWRAPVERAIALRHVRLRSDWAELKGRPDYLRRFVLSGVPCFSFFEPLLDHLVEVEFRESLVLAAVLSRRYRRADARAVVVPFDSPAPARLRVLVAESFGVPSIVCQHGVMSFRLGHDELLTATYAATISQEDARELERCRKGVRAIIVGCPQFDQLASAAAAAPAPPAHPPSPSRPLRILVLTYSCHAFSVRSSASDSETFLTGVVRALEPLGDKVHVTFKLHPAEKRERYEEDMRLLRPELSYELSTGWRLPALLPVHDLVICPPSTGAAEALFLRKPVIQFRTLVEPVPLAFERGSALPTAEDPDELTRMVARAAEDYQAFCRSYDFSVAERYFGPQDGNAAGRLAAAILDLVRGGASGRSDRTSGSVPNAGVSHDRN